MHSHRFLAVFIGVLAVPTVCFAHGSGQSFEKMTDRHLIDIGFDVPFQVGEEVLLDFGLFTVNEGEVDGLANFTNLALTIHSGATILYERSIDKPEFGKVFVTMTPERDGNWTLTADFTAHGTPVESASFDFVIAPGENTVADTISDALIFGVIIMILAFAAFFIFRKPCRPFP